MKLLIISALAAVALLAAITNMLESNMHSTVGIAGPAAMPSLQDLQSAPGVNNLRSEEFEDGSLVYSRGAKQ
jgi:hypothetical protein